MSCGRRHLIPAGLVIALFAVVLAGRLAAHANETTRIVPRGEPAPRVAFTWLGVTHWVMETPAGAALLDAYESRPPFTPEGTTEAGLAYFRRVLRVVKPGTIRWIFVGHSHSDHAVDAGAFARETGALVIGSATTCFVTQASGLPADRCLAVAGGETLDLGRLEVRVLASLHTAPTVQGLGAYQVLTAPPANASSAPNGGNLSFLFRLRVAAEGPPLTWFYSNSLSGIDADDGSGRDYRAIWSEFFAENAAPHLWLASTLITGAEMGEYLDIVHPQAVIPQHWDGTRPVITDGLIASYEPPEDMAAAFDAREIALVGEQQYGDRFELTTRGLRRLENRRVKAALGLPVEAAP